MIRSFLLSVVLLTVTACSSVDYEKNISIAPGGWHKDSVIRFALDIQRTDIPYRMDLFVRNDNSYPYSNLYLFVSMVSPSGTVVRDTAEYVLADAYGQWLGKGWCANYDHALQYQSAYTFPVKGVYTVEITQAMREIKLKGIKDVGFSLRKYVSDGKE